MTVKPENDDKVLAVVLAALPGRHLEIWAKVRAQMPEVHPAQVWRALASGQLKRDEESGQWTKTG